MIGDANVDLEIRLPKGGVSQHANPDPRLFGGGSAANTAAALARLGEQCSFVGTVGDDSYGRFAVESLRQAGVNTESVKITPDDSTVTVITVLPTNGDRLIYVWPPRGGAHGLLQWDQAVGALEGSDWLHVSGICLRLSPARETILKAMQRAKEAGISVSFDLNLRLENWGWEAGFREVVESAMTSADVIFGAAIDEINPMAGLDDPIQAATQLAGPNRVVIARMGKRGAMACSSDGITRAPSFDVEVIDTVGAGDAFNAGFISARRRQLDMAEAIRWGNAVAALTIAKAGARSTPTLDEVERLLAKLPAGSRDPGNRRGTESDEQQELD